MLHLDQRNIMYSKTYSDDTYEHNAYFIWVKNRKTFILLYTFLLFLQVSKSIKSTCIANDTHG